MEQKPYSELSTRQKRRRIAEADDKINKELTAESLICCVILSDDEESLDKSRNVASLQNDSGGRTAETAPGTSSSNAGPSSIESIEPDEPLLLDTSIGNNSLQEVPTLEVAVDENDDTRANLSDVTKIETAIRNFSIDCPNFPNQQLNCLLHHLHSFFPDIILTARTLKKEGQLDVAIKKLHYGRYAHLNNWQESISNHLKLAKFQDPKLFLNINIDGIPLYQDARNFHAYPILLELCIPEEPKIICVGVYLSEFGDSNKMPDVNDFLEDFVQELSLMLCKGLTIGTTHIKVCIKAFVCDAPARSALKKIVNHNSYAGCERCVQKGSYAGGHVVLDKMNAPLRSDRDFVAQTDPAHHKEGPESIIRRLGIGMVSNFPLDYMHLTCLGVMKRMLCRLKHSKKGEVKCNLDNTKQKLLDDEIDAFSSHVPSDFNRKLAGGFRSLAYWKATELRLFMLYAGIVVLSGFLPESYYLNFLNFSLAMRILLSKNQISNVENARALLKNFVSGSKELYGLSFLSYNVHSLIHLPDDYVKYGSLDEVSCFPFENYLGVAVKGRLSGRNKPLEQICRHLSLENKKFSSVKSAVKMGKANKCIWANGSLLKSGVMGDRDNCIMLKSGEIAVITAIDKNSLTVDILQKQSLFLNPIDSQLLGIHKVHSSNKQDVVTPEQIHSKMMLVPKNDSYIAIKLLHSK